MKRIIFLMALLPIVIMSCSKNNNDDKTPITKSEIFGNWSTGVNDIHKYLEFSADGTGFYALFNGATMGQNYLFSYEVYEEYISIKITYSETKNLIGETKVWNCSIINNNLVIENDTEKGTYKKLK